jgi:hypothetical protein
LINLCWQSMDFEHQETWLLLKVKLEAVIDGFVYAPLVGVEYCRLCWLVKIHLTSKWNLTVSVRLCRP